MHEGPDQHAGAGEQHDAQRDLGGDEQTSGPAAASADHATGATIGQGGAQVGACRLKRRHQTEQDAGQQREGRGHEQHPAVEPHLLPDAQGVDREHAHTEHAEVADARTGDTAEHREHQALGQQLSQDRQATAAEGHPRGDLPGARRRSRQQQTRRVDAADQQHDAHRGPDQEQP